MSSKEQTADFPESVPAATERSDTAATMVPQPGKAPAADRAEESSVMNLAAGVAAVEAAPSNAPEATESEEPPLVLTAWLKHFGAC